MPIIVRNSFTAREAIHACRNKGYSLTEGQGELFTCDASWGWSIDHIQKLKSEDAKDHSRAPSARPV